MDRHEWHIARRSAYRLHRDVIRSVERATPLAQLGDLVMPPRGREDQTYLSSDHNATGCVETSVVNLAQRALHEGVNTSAADAESMRTTC
jgi:hypothetical protein